LTGKGREAGSAWVLAPAAILVLMVLASITVDSAVVFLGQRQLGDSAASAAYDAAHAISQAAFYQDGEIELDPATATALADRAVTEDHLSAVTLVGEPQVTVSGATVCVRLTGVVQVIFARAIPGAPRQAVVHATARATAAGAGQEGPTPC